MTTSSFISQVEENDSYYSQENNKNNKYEANLGKKSTADLMVSDNLDLAIELTGGEPKVFFATEQRVNEANGLLKGKVKLEMTGKYLKIGSDGGKKILYQVIPVVKSQKKKGVDVTTPQRCNEAAQFVTGLVGLDMEVGKQYFQIVTELLRDLTGRDFPKEYGSFTKRLLSRRRLRSRILHWSTKSAPSSGGQPLPRRDRLQL